MASVLQGEQPGNKVRRWPPSRCTASGCVQVPANTMGLAVGVALNSVMNARLLREAASNGSSSSRPPGHVYCRRSRATDTMRRHSCKDDHARGVQFRLMLCGLVPVDGRHFLGGCGSLFRLVGPVGSELDHLLGAAAWDGADELAGEQDLEDGGVQSDGDDLAGEVAAG
jgi:hypothetical protein